MSATPILTKSALYHSHLVNCKECHNKITGNPSIHSSWKIRDLLCPVGRKLFDEAVKENPKNAFRPTNFPFVAKQFQLVIARVGNQWIKGRVVDRSIGADGTVVGYEVEYEVLSKRFVDKVERKRVYVNRNNIHKAGDGTQVKASYEVKTQSFKFKIGEKPKVEPIIEQPKFRFRIGEKK